MTEYLVDLSFYFNEIINFMWDKIRYSLLKKCGFQRYKLDNDRFLKIY